MTKKGEGLLGVLESIRTDKKLNVSQDTIATGKELVEYISTGSIIVDKLLGKTENGKTFIGGVGKGRIVEIFGLESSGKTTLALSICREAQKKGGNVAFVDFEAALDVDYAEKAVGVDVSPERFAWLRPENLEEGCNIVDHLLDKHSETKIDVIVMDSVKAMIPKIVMDGMMGDEAPMALQARRIGQWLGKIIKRIKDTGTSLVLLNQMTKNIKTNPFSPGGEFETPGGLAVRFYASQRIELKLVTKQTKKGINPITNEEEEIPDSNKVRASIIKNKIGTPYRKAEFYIKYGGGIDNRRSVVEMAVSHGIIQKGGAWFSYKPELGGFKLQGEESMHNFLFSPENRGILKEIADKLIFTQDEEVKAQAHELEKVENKLANKLKNKKSKEKNSSEEEVWTGEETV
jgi:recombination protein RecA